jgi:hypothetical protein
LIVPQPDSGEMEKSVQRVVEPEILDGLPPEDPRALRARRDLKRVNTMMLQHIIMARALSHHCADKQPRVLADLGSGDGTLLLRVAQRLGPQWRGMKAILVDQRDAVSAETRHSFGRLGWDLEVVTQGVFEFFEQPRAPHIDVITANLFLHHLQDRELAALFAKAAQATETFVVGELRRTRFVRETGRYMWLLGGGDVICKDGIISARAAFLGKELSALWPRDDAWETFEHAVGPWTHLFVARRTRPNN